MKAMLTAFVATIIIAVAAFVGLHRLGFSSAEMGTGEAVRLESSGN